MCFPLRVRTARLGSAPAQPKRLGVEMANSNTQDWLGKPISRKAVSHFIFVQHLYPRLSERRPHSHPWLHLSIVQRRLYARSLGTRISHYRAGTMALLATDESHTDSFAPGTKCLHMVIPSHLETLLARDFASRGRTPFTPLHSINAQCAVALTASSNGQTATLRS